MTASDFNEYFNALDEDTHADNNEDILDDFDGVDLNDIVKGLTCDRAQPQDITCANKINVKGTVSTKKTHEAVDALDFDKMNANGKSFVEFLLKPQYVHLYIDVDEVNTVEEYLDFKLWLNKLSAVFGKYSIGGYTNDEQFVKYGYRLWPESDKVLSLHVVFYETCISSADLIDIMGTKNGQFINYDVNPLCDSNVYKLNTRQAFRHVLSDKIYNRKGDDKYKPNHGYILDNNKPSTQIITVRGGEPIITKEQWLKVFTPMVGGHRLSEAKPRPKTDEACEAVIRR